MYIYICTYIYTISIPHDIVEKTWLTRKKTNMNLGKSPDSLEPWLPNFLSDPKDMDCTVYHSHDPGTMIQTLGEKKVVFPW